MHDECTLCLCMFYFKSKIKEAKFNLLSEHDAKYRTLYVNLILNQYDAFCYRNAMLRTIKLCVCIVGKRTAR